MQYPSHTKRVLTACIAALLLVGGVQAASRTWTYTYHPSGLLATANGPRTDIVDVVSHAYDANGRRTQVQNALGQITTLSNFDSYGRPQTITDPNGIATALAYTPQGWLESITMAGSTTSYEYDAAGQVIAVTLGDGSWLEYTWDNARRITTVLNNLSERIEYTLDAQGNRTAEKVRDASSTLRRQQQRVFDELGRLLQHIGAGGQTTDYGYDLNDNHTGQATPKSDVYTQAFDALNRLVSSTDPLSGLTARAYDGQDNLTQLIDPRGVTTNYTYDGLGNLTQLNSPDTGTTSYGYDAAGNVTQATDARGVVTHYTYDALNRPLSRNYPATPSLNVQYGYDATAGGNHGIGRRTSIQDASGTLAYIYNARGDLTVQTHTAMMEGALRTEALGYAYDDASRIARIDYPANFSIQYTRNAGGQVTGVALQPSGGTPVPIVSGIIYLPFGPLQSLIWGNGLGLTRTHDQDYRLTSQAVGAVWSSSYTYDVNGNITQIGSSSWGTLGYNYDALDRLTGSARASQSLGYAYDAAGNRTAKAIINIVGGTPGPATNTLYTYNTANNRLTAIGAQPVYSDSAGNLTQDRAVREYTHDAQGRLQSVIVDGDVAASYIHNALGQRTHKRTPVGTTTYLYAQNGQLLGLKEYAATGLPVKSQYYVWLGTEPVAAVQASYGSLGTITSTTVLYLHADHLETPRLATNASQTVVWKLPQTEAFGAVEAEQDPDMNGVQTDIALRFPGQIADADSGLHYNYHRDYDPWTGRYIQSDPIGLAGGINTFAYVGGNPLSYSDPLGLNPVAGGYAGAGIGSAFGPVGTVVGGVIGAGIGAAIGWNVIGPMLTKPPENAYDPNGPKAPGKPTEADGFKPPKGGDNWVPNPNPGRGGSSWGWEDSKGDVWCPTGQGGRAHGDPHWDIQSPGGGYRNKRPQQ